VVTSLVAAGYQLFAINPMASSRYRDRHAVSGAKSDPGDAKVLTDLVRTDRHNHRPIAGDTDLVEGVKLLARVHQSAIWGRRRQLNALRSALREYYPAALVAFGMGSLPWRCHRGASPSPRPPSSAGRCRVRRSPPLCAEGTGPQRRAVN
jgi:hypothetical protein